MECQHCKRDIDTPIAADGHTYCGRICAAMGLLWAQDQQDAFDEEFIEDTIIELIFGIMHEGPTIYPVRIRYSDALDFEGYSERRKGFAPVSIIIGDGGTPDWTPGATA